MTVALDASFAAERITAAAGRLAQPVRDPGPCRHCQATGRNAVNTGPCDYCRGSGRYWCNCPDLRKDATR